MPRKRSSRPAADFAKAWQKTAVFAKPWQIVRRAAVCFFFAAALLPAAFPRAAAAQKIGPYPIVFKGTGNNVVTSSVTISRREKNTLWVSFAGSARGEQGIPVRDIKTIAVPPPAPLAAAGQLLSRPVPSDPAKKDAFTARLSKTLSELDREIRIFTPYRTLPGIPAADLLLAKGRLLLKVSRDTEAVQVFETLLDFLPPEDPRALTAQILAGIAYSRTGNALQAIEYLSPLAPPADDEALLSDMFFALGDAYLALGNADNALLTYLHLLVFHPFVHHNEPRLLEKVLPCYAAIGDWESLLRTVRWIQRDYPSTPAAETARKCLEKYAAQIGEAQTSLSGGGDAGEDDYDDD
jgi:tetratricopeptide (TPR) repeat protein